MKQYNLSQIMKAAHAMFKTGKYASFAEALRKSWKTAKFRRQVEAEQTETAAFHEAQRQEAQAKAIRAERAEVERIAYIAELRAQGEQERTERAARVEAECNAYGYGRGNHYSAWSGWGNYCGD